MQVTAGNAGGVGATVAGVARVPFVAGIDHYLPAFFGKLHPRWKTPWISILIQAGISAIILILTTYVTTVKKGYLFLVDMSVILYFIPFLYMYAAAIRLAYRPDRQISSQAVLVPGGKPGVWIAGLLGFIVTLGSMGLAMVPAEDVKNIPLFEFSLVAATAIAIGKWTPYTNYEDLLPEQWYWDQDRGYEGSNGYTFAYWRGARTKPGLYF